MDKPEEEFQEDTNRTFTNDFYMEFELDQCEKIVLNKETHCTNKI